MTWKSKSYRWVAHRRIQQCRWLRRKTMQPNLSELPHIVPWDGEEPPHHGKYLDSRLHRRCPELHPRPSPTGGSYNGRNPLPRKLCTVNFGAIILHGSSHPLSPPRMSSPYLRSPPPLPAPPEHLCAKTKAQEHGCAYGRIGEGAITRKYVEEDESDEGCKLLGENAKF
jgi:hypothetical protein